MVNDDDGGQFQQTVQQWEAMDEPTKRCNTCGKERYLSEFPTCSTLRDGHRNECKRCTKAYLRDYRERNFDRLRALGRAYSALPHVREVTYAKNKAWRDDEANDRKRLAHYALNRALKTGIVKAQPCWVCGEKAEAHHPDYAEPLLVVWLCKSHHKQAHAQGHGHEDRRPDSK